MPTSKSTISPRKGDENFGYREALAEVTAQLAASEQRRVEAERAARRASWRRGPALLDARGLALTA